jgi:membrane protein DedA with SNARE-associated domain
MSNFIQTFINYLNDISSIVPLPVFTFLGALIEEIIAPIPSPIVMTLAGSLAAVSNSTVFYLGLLAFTGSIGKTIGAYVIYYISDRAENVIIQKFGKFIGVTEKDVERISAKLNSGRRDDLVLFLLRAIPIVPTAPVSVVCGLIKIKLKTYLWTTFLGTLVRNIIYLYLGFTSLNAVENINSEIDSLEKFGYAIVLIVVAIIFFYIYTQKKKQKE